ncbi:unnamed protein product, partial [Mesorhabditis spiculigera]
MFRYFLILVIIPAITSLQIVKKWQFERANDWDVCEVDYDEKKQILKLDCVNERWDRYRECVFPIASYDECLCHKIECINGLSRQFGLVFDGYYQKAPSPLRSAPVDTTIEIEIPIEDIYFEDAEEPSEAGGGTHGAVAILSYVSATIAWFARNRVHIGSFLWCST